MDQQIIGRVCTKCGVSYPATLAFFSKQKAGKFGLTSACKSCRKKATQNWRKANPGKYALVESRRYERNRDGVLAKNAKWRGRNPDKAKQSTIEWIERNRDKYLAKRKEYREANAAAIKAKFTEWYAKNRAKEVAAAAKRREANPARDRANARAWYYRNWEQGRASRDAWLAANPDRKRVYSENRRAKKAGSNGKLSPNIADMLLMRQGGKCACCGAVLEKYHLDHIVPLALGGEHVDSNMQLLTPRCNMMKGAKTPEEYEKYRLGLNT